MTQEPLAYFLDNFGYNSKLVKRFEVGEKYSIVELKDGNCGVCGLNKADTSNEIPVKINLNNYSHRTLYACYLNASFNHKQTHLNKSSFPEKIENGAYKNIVMIGLFRPLLKRFELKNISPLVFDINKTDNCLTPMEQRNKALKNADLVILSATTIVNNTFIDIIRNTNSKATINITGPTALMHPDIFKWCKKGVVSGMVFQEDTSMLFKFITTGFGTQHFKVCGKKVDFTI